MCSIITSSLGFKCSTDEIEALLRILYEDFSESIENEKFNMTILIQVVDILKREKLVLVRLANYLNYIIFTILMGLMLAYITFFYSYKDSHD
jgi:hypothetical protein